MNTFSNAKVRGSVFVVVVVVSKLAARFRVLGLSQVIAPQANSDLVATSVPCPSVPSVTTFKTTLDI